jgi:tetratricopeptide (TPR) repeat protein
LILRAALAVGMAIAAPRPVDQTRAFEQAKSALRLGQIEQATELLRALQKSHPDSAWPSLYLALAHEAAGKHADANACFRDARHGQDAAEAFRQCGIDNPNSIVVLINQALFHVEHERYEPARAALDQAMKVNPRDIRVFALLGDIDRKQKRSEAAIANFLNAISLATHDPIEYQTLFECRKIALYLLDRQINTLLAHRTLARPEREALAGHAGRIETIVNAPGFLVEIPRDLGKDQPIRALEAYSRGIAAVARARCAGGRPASEPMLRTARMHLEASRRLSESTTDATQIPPIKELEKRIKEAESTLEPLHGESPL